MNKYKVSSMTPFIPSKDFVLSKEFYEDIGFSKVAEKENAILYEVDGFGFWLQDYYVKVWADNCMLCLYVDNIGLWWGQIKDIVQKTKYKEHVNVFSEPHEQEGSIMMQFSDPSGVLWHVREDKIV